MTALVRPTSNVKSGRKRVRAYHSLSFLREKSPSYKFAPADVIWSNRPLIVTFGAGACANAAGARNPRMATRHATTATVRLMHCLLSCGAFRLTSLRKATSPTEAETTDNATVLPQGLGNVKQKLPFQPRS